MAFSWVFAGGKAQGLGILDAAAAEGFVPERIAVPKGLGDDDRLRLEAWARAHDIETVAPGKLRSEHVDDVDLLLVCRFELLKRPIFSAPRWATLNVHSALLPEYRGVHPISWALVDDAKETGVTVHHIDDGIDSGAVVAQRRVTIRDDHDLHSLTAEIDAISADVVVELFRHVEITGGVPSGTPQRGTGTYARRRTPEDGCIDWTKSARAVWSLVRALPPPLPSAFTYDAHGAKRCVHSARIVGTGFVGRPGTIVAIRGDEAVVCCGEGAVAVRFDGEARLGLLSRCHGVAEFGPCP